MTYFRTFLTAFWSGLDFCNPIYSGIKIDYVIDNRHKILQLICKLDMLITIIYKKKEMYFSTKYAKSFRNICVTYYISSYIEWLYHDDIILKNSMVIPH